MKIDLSGKRALVTGSTEGIGFAVAIGLARAGAAVVVNGRAEDKTRAAAARLAGTAQGAKVEAVAADLATAAGCAALVAAVPEPDILINNVGIFETKPFAEITDADWERYFQVNVMSGVRLSRAYLPGMMKRDWGRILFVASESGLNIPVDMIHYGVSKTAQIGIARGLAKVAAGTGVTVNSVLPGPTRTEGVESMLKDEIARTGKSIDEVGADFVMRERASSIIRRLALPEEIANMMVYLCSPQAAATTGAAVRVDGGVLDTIA